MFRLVPDQHRLTSQLRGIEPGHVGICRDATDVMQSARMADYVHTHYPMDDRTGFEFGDGRGDGELPFPMRLTAELLESAMPVWGIRGVARLRHIHAGTESFAHSDAAEDFRILVPVEGEGELEVIQYGRTSGNAPVTIPLEVGSPVAINNMTTPESRAWHLSRSDNGVLLFVCGVLVTPVTASY